MLALQTNTPKLTFSQDEIKTELQKILFDPVFRYSEILKNFLSYIVNETLQERTNRLKEYTIAVNVLDKPADFNPQEYGIVRIHAGRLRAALDKYYTGRGRKDSIRISIPKGSYVPAFEENEFLFKHHLVVLKKPTVIGVAPFRFAQNKKLGNCFADGLAMQLSSRLARNKNFTIVADYTMNHLFESNASIEKIRSVTGAQVIITGEILAVNNDLHIHEQFIRTLNSQLIFSHMLELNYSADRIFEIQGEIVDHILRDALMIDMES